MTDTKTDTNSSAEALRRRATEHARRAAAAQDPVVESGHRRLARHCLKRAAELEDAADQSSARGVS